MAYFPNGTAAGNYQAKYCDNCLHDVDSDCAVWLLHFVTDYCDKNGEPSPGGKMLDLLIPENGGQCFMFVDGRK